jgi:hypothetical protein
MAVLHHLLHITLSDHAARKSGNARRKPARVSPMRSAELWAAARHKALRAKNTVSTVFFTLSDHAEARKCAGTEKADWFSGEVVI